MRHAMSIKSDATAVLPTSHTIIATLQCVTYSDQASPISSNNTMTVLVCHVRAT